MKSVKLLIDMAAQRAGSDAELARRAGVPRSHVAMWRSGARPISAESVIVLCDVLELPGEETREWVALAIIENPKNASRVEVLKRALFACWVLGGASLLTLFSAALLSLGTVRSAEAKTAAHIEGYTSVTDTVYIVAYSLWVKAVVPSEGKA